MKIAFLRILLILLVLLFLVNVFRYLGHPLLWNDEAETAVYGERILKYGYPKVHDGKNTVFLPTFDDHYIGYREKNDAFIATTWGQFYVASIGVLLSRTSDDFFQKTCWLRMVFAIIGVFGIILTAYSARGFFKDDRRQWLLFLILFFLFELLSVSLVLHIREVRYYSIVIFLSGMFLTIYANYRFFHLLKTSTYIFMICGVLFSFFHTFYISFYAFCAVILVYEFFAFISNYFAKRFPQTLFADLFPKTDFKILMQNVLPCTISILALIPFMIYFDIFAIASAVSKLYQFNWMKYFLNLKFIIKYFVNYEFIFLIVFSKLFLLILWHRNPPSENELLKRKLQFSNFLLITVLISALMVARTPFIFERYFIHLQPILVLGCCLDLLTSWELIKDRSIRFARLSYFAGIFLLTMAGCFSQWSVWKGRLYELSHVYRGPLDEVITYIKNQYEKPEELVIATNYEECSFIFYLKSKVIIGYSRWNFEEDKLLKPDIISFRKGWRRNSGILGEMINRYKYRKITFKIFDYRVNNIPELLFEIKHLFQTKYAANDDEAIDLFIKEE